MHGSSLREASNQLWPHFDQYLLPVPMPLFLFRSIESWMIFSPLPVLFIWKLLRPGWLQVNWSGRNIGCEPTFLSFPLVKVCLGFSLAGKQYTCILAWLADPARLTQNPGEATFWCCHQNCLNQVDQRKVKNNNNKAILTINNNSLIYLLFRQRTDFRNFLQVAVLIWSNFP